MKCNTLRLAVLAVVLVSFNAVAQPSLAVPTQFFDRDDTTTFMTSYPSSLAEFNVFTASLTSFAVDDIDTAGGVNPTLIFGGSGIVAATQGVLAQNAPGFQIGAQALLELDAVGFPQVDTVLTFNTYITSFGAYVIQGGDAANNNPITFRLRDTATNAFVDVTRQVGPGWGFDNAFFLGVTDTVKFDQVEILESADFNDGLLLDNIVAGGAVPEPGSLALLMLGAACTLCRTARFRRG